MQAKITISFVKSLAPTGRDTFVYDTETTGFGLKVSGNGEKVRKTYFAEARVGKGRGAPKRRVMIGAHGAFTPETAREKAKEILRTLASGTDVTAERRKEKATRHKAAEKAKERTFGAVCEKYLAEQVRGRLKRAKQTEGQLRKHFLPHWQDRDIGDIKRADVMGLLRGMEAAGSAGAARKALAEVRPLFGYAVTLELISTNPAAGRNIIATKYKGRERALEDSELGEVWRAAETLGYPFGPMVHMLMLTGQRLEEVAEVPWSEFDFDEGVWTIPGPRTKPDRGAHFVHLSPQALAVLRGAADTLAEHLDLPTDDSGVVLFEVAKQVPYVFTTTLRSPVSGFSRAKEHLDTAIAKARAKAAGGGDAEAMPHWTFHDLRRSFSTGCALRGVPSHVVEKVLNHNPSSLKGVAAIYNRYEYLPERKAVIEMWGKEIETIANGEPTPSNVVRIRSAGG